MSTGARFDPEPARRIARRAAAGARNPGNEVQAELRTALQAAETHTRRERAAAPWRRDPELEAAAWRSVESAASRALAERRQTVRSARDRSPAAALEAAAAVRRAEWEIRDPASDRRERALLLARAMTWLALGRRAASAGRPLDAVGHFSRARSEALEVHRRWLDQHARFRDPELLRLWQGWAREALAAAGANGSRQLLVDKLERTLKVYAGGRLEMEFAIELGSNGLERKLHAGDRATPEGHYRVRERRGPGRTRYHRALLLDYPNDEDRRRWAAARRAGRVPPESGPGGLIEIHGMGGRGIDWTDGCVALANEDMDRLFELAAEGTRVTIVGSLEAFDEGT